MRQLPASIDWDPLERPEGLLLWEAQNPEAFITARGSRETVLVDLALHNANRHTAINGPAITVPPLQAKLADPRPSCRNAILHAIDQLHQRTGATQFARRDIVAEVQATIHSFERQTIYRCIRRMTGYEPGSAHHDLEDLGNDQLRLRRD